MADVELQAVVSIDINASMKKIKQDANRLSKEVKKLLSDIKIKLGPIDAQQLTRLENSIKQASQRIEQSATIKPKVDIDLSAERAKFNQIQTVARDTGKVIDQELKSKLELDVAQATLVLKQIRKEIKTETDKETLIRLNIEARNVQSQLTEFKRGLNNLQNTGTQSLSRLQSKFDQVKSSIGGVVGVLKGGLGFAGLTIGLGQLQQGFDLAIQKAISFERAFTNVQKTFKGSQQSFDNLKQSLIELSQTELPLPVEELANIASLGSQLGVAGDDLLKFTDTIARLGVSTNITTEEAATSLARLTNVFQLPIGSVEKLGSTLVDLGNNFATTENDIIQFTRFLGPAGKQAGLSAQDILGIGTALSSVGINAEAGGSAISKALNSINVAVATGSSKISKFAEVAGLSADEFVKKRESNPASAFVSFVEGLGKSGDQATLVIDELIGSDVRLRNALLASAGAGNVLRDALGRANIAYIENNALLNESAQFFSDAKADADRYSNALAAQQAEIGTKLLPVYTLLQQALLGIGSVISTLVGGVANVIKFFTDFGTGAQILTASIVGLGAAIAFISFGPIVAGIGAFLATLPALITGIGSLTVGATTLGGIFTVLTGGIPLLIGGLVTLASIVAFNFGAIKEFTFGLFGLQTTQADTVKTTQELGNEFANNQKKIEELTKAGGDNKKQIEELQTANKDLASQLGITETSISSLTDRYFQNQEELANLDKQLKEGVITQEQYAEKTSLIQQQQDFLKASLGEAELAQEGLTKAQIAYKEASLDTSVSQAELERLRQKAIQAAQAVVQALILQDNAERASAGPRAFQPGQSLFSETQQKLAQARKDLEELKKQETRTTTTPTATGGGARRTGGGGGKSEAQKQIEEEQKAFEKAQAEKERLLAKEQQLLQDLAKVNKDQSKALYDETVKNIQKAGDEIAKLDAKIAGLQTSLAELGVQEDTNLAKRVIEINKELQNQKLTTEERVALQKELALATANTTQEEIKRQQLISEESVTERILRETAEKKAQLEQELADAQAQKEAQLAILADETAKKEAINQAFFDKYKESIADAYNTELQKINEIKTALQEVRALREGLSTTPGSGGGAGTAGNRIANVTNNVSVSAQVSNNVDIDDLGKRIAREINNGQAGIF